MWSAFGDERSDDASSSTSFGSRRLPRVASSQSPNGSSASKSAQKSCAALCVHHVLRAFDGAGRCCLGGSEGGVGLLATVGADESVVPPHPMPARRRRLQRRRKRMKAGAEQSAGHARNAKNRGGYR